LWIERLHLIALQYLTDLKDWSLPIKAVDDWVKAEKAKQASTTGDNGKETSSMSVVHASQLVLPSDATKETTGFYKQLVLLHSGKSHTDTSDLHKVYTNFSFAAAAVGLSSHAQWWKIEDVNGLKAEMAKYVVLLYCFTSRRNIISSDTMLQRRIKHFSSRSRRRITSMKSSCRINSRLRSPRWCSCYRRKFMAARFAEIH
jgi:hypothetical protein